MIRQLCMLIVLALSIVACDRTNDAPPPSTTTANTTVQVDEEPQPPEPEPVVDKLLIWEVTPPGKPDAKSYLVGTYHLGTDFHGVGELPEPGRTAFQSARVVVLEADLGLVDPELDKLMVIEGPRTLEAMLSPEQWEVALEQTGLPPRQLERLQPHTVAAELSRKWTPGAGVRGMDGRFRILAKAYEKKLAFLETPRQQIELISEAITPQLLGEMLDRAEEEKERSVKLLETFESGDATALEAQLFAPADVKAHRDFYDKVFWKRNEAWVEPLKPLLDEGGAFIAVGAGHLLGEKSLLSLLEEAGYSVAAASP